MIGTGSAESARPVPRAEPRQPAADFDGGHDLSDYGGLAMPVAEAETMTTVRPVTASASVAAGWEHLLAARRARCWNPGSRKSWTR